MSCYGEELQGWFQDGGLSNLELEVMSIEQSSGAFTDHVDGDVAGFHASRGQSKATRKNNLIKFAGYVLRRHAARRRDRSD